ncbi:MAG: hypothetical protein HC882_06930 [Acidobacteria bacterium]|nr:hypothetical protein [Acidobacteriota bacterium]
MKGDGEAEEVSSQVVGDEQGRVLLRIYERRELVLEHSELPRRDPGQAVHEQVSNVANDPGFVGP